MPDKRAGQPELGSDAPPDTTRRRRRRPPAAQTIGGVLFGFEQQVWRTAPPPQELVHHARPDAPVPAGDGTMITIELPRDPAQPRPRDEDEDEDRDGLP